MTKPDKPPNPDRPITNSETRHWREQMLARATCTAEASERSAAALERLVAHFTKATYFNATITSQPLTGQNPVPNQGGTHMPQPPITGTVEPNCKAQIDIIPLTEAGEPKELDGTLGFNIMEPTTYSLDPADPKHYILLVDPPADLDAVPETHITVFDTADNDPSLDITVNWKKGTVVIKATQFAATISSVPIA